MVALKWPDHTQWNYILQCRVQYGIVFILVWNCWRIMNSKSHHLILWNIAMYKLICSLEIHQLHYPSQKNSTWKLRWFVQSVEGCHFSVLSWVEWWCLIHTLRKTKMNPGHRVVFLWHYLASYISHSSPKSLVTWFYPLKIWRILNGKVT